MKTHKLTVVCCRCHRVKTGDGWRLAGGSENNQTRQSHGYCPECFKYTMAELESNPVELMAAS